ncbi:hypothetical protein LPJ73_005540, partial [Coemansia sp. RSA 2703]
MLRVTASAGVRAGIGARVAAAAASTTKIRSSAVPLSIFHSKIPQLQRGMHRRSFFSFRRLADADNSLRTPLVVAAAALVASTLGFVGYAMFFGPGNQYPPPVRSLLREGGMAYLRTENKQDLPKAVEKYTEALRLLDKIGASDPKHAPDTPHVTGLVARIASVYTDMGDIDNTIRTYTDLLHRILGDSGMEDPRTQVRLLMDPELDGGKRQNIL